MYHTHTLQKKTEIYDRRKMKSRRRFLPRKKLHVSICYNKFFILTLTGRRVRERAFFVSQKRA
jgi:hypothetical protein